MTYDQQKAPEENAVHEEIAHTYSILYYAAECHIDQHVASRMTSLMFDVLCKPLLLSRE